MSEQKELGYHLNEIPQGVLGEVSKIREELSELEDAAMQGVKIMELVEAADLYGALEAYMERHHPGRTIEDLRQMNEVTKRAFLSGRRASKAVATGKVEL